MSYAMRFRNRNQLANIGRRKIQSYQLTGGSCQASPSYGWVSGGDSGELQAYTKVDTIDDVAGDPPQRKLGPAGFKFHPLTRVVAELTGDGTFAWTARVPGGICGAGSPDFKTVRECSGLSATLLWSGLTIPMDGQRLDMSKVSFPESICAQLQDLAGTACLAKRGKFGESNLYESLAEVDKTLGMMRDILSRAHRIQQTAFFGKKGTSRLRTFSNEAAGQYLLTRYGFMPLVKDLEAILVGLDKPLGRVLQRSVGLEEWSDQQTVTRPDRIDANTVVFGESYTKKQTLQVKALSLDSAEVNLLQRLGLGWKDFVSVPWELLGYSFVADWFANIGDVISAIAPTVGLSPHGSCVVIRWACEETVSWTLKGLVAGASGTVLESANAPGPITRKIYNTTRITGLPSPRLQWRSNFKFDNTTRVLDALALFTNAAAKVRPALAKSPVSETRRLKARNWTDEAGISRQQGVRSPDRFLG